MNLSYENVEHFDLYEYKEYLKKLEESEKRMSLELSNLRFNLTNKDYIESNEFCEDLKLSKNKFYEVKGLIKKLEEIKEQTSKDWANTVGNIIEKLKKVQYFYRLEYRMLNTENLYKNKQSLFYTDGNDNIVEVKPTDENYEQMYKKAKSINNGLIIDFVIPKMGGKKDDEPVNTNITDYVAQIFKLEDDYKNGKPLMYHYIDSDGQEDDIELTNIDVNYERAYYQAKKLLQLEDAFVNKKNIIYQGRIVSADSFNYEDVYNNKKKELLALAILETPKKRALLS